MIGVLIAILLAAVAYFICVAIGLPAIVGIVAAILVLLAGSMLLLAIAARSIPLGTAYSVWVGIGAVGAAIVGIVWHGDPATPLRLVFLALLIVSIVGLKLTGAD